MRRSLEQARQRLVGGRRRRAKEVTPVLAGQSTRTVTAEAADCASEDPNRAIVDRCGICGGDDSTCLILEDGFESGDTSAWSAGL